MNYTLQKIYANYTVLINNEIFGDGYIRYRIDGHDVIAHTELIPYATSFRGKIGLQPGKIDDWKESKESIISIDSDDDAIEVNEKTDLTELFSSMVINNISSLNKIEFVKRRDIFELTINKSSKAVAYLFIHDFSAFNHDPSFSQAKIVQAKDYSKYIRFSIIESDDKIIEQVYSEQK